MLAERGEDVGDDSMKIVINKTEKEDADEMGDKEIMDPGTVAHTPEFLDYDEPCDVEAEKLEVLERLNKSNEKLRKELREVK
eukprot:g21208.t1